MPLVDVPPTVDDIEVSKQIDIVKRGDRTSVRVNGRDISGWMVAKGLVHASADADGSIRVTVTLTAPKFTYHEEY